MPKRDNLGFAKKSSQRATNKIPSSPGATSLADAFSNEPIMKSISSEFVSATVLVRDGVGGVDAPGVGIARGEAGPADEIAGVAGKFFFGVVGGDTTVPRGRTPSGLGTGVGKDFCVSCFGDSASMVIFDALKISSISSKSDSNVACSFN
jgi:hypothetical protein